jgi:hypothetical protein
VYKFDQKLAEAAILADFCIIDNHLAAMNKFDQIEVS